jgi:hypothetical protein
MAREHTPEQLQQALAELRRKHRDWPDDVTAVLDHPIRSRLLHLAASVIANGGHVHPVTVVRPVVVRPDPPPLAHLTLRPPSTSDRKRAAAGERDD